MWQVTWLDNTTTEVYADRGFVDSNGIWMFVTEGEGVTQTINSKATREVVKIDEE